MIEAVALGPIHAEAVNEAGFAIGDIKRKRLRIEREAAERGPELGRPSGFTSANRLTAPVTPSIFQIDPGPPPAALPQRPGMKVAFGAPLRTCTGSPSGPGATIGRP